jgi:hypothetical protein
MPLPPVGALEAGESPQRRKDSTVAATDRLVHHPVILEFDEASQRVKRTGEKTAKAQPGWPGTNDGAAAPNPAGLRQLAPFCSPLNPNASKR